MVGHQVLFERSTQWANLACLPSTSLLWIATSKHHPNNIGTKSFEVAAEELPAATRRPLNDANA
jgi:hypothetical protein